MLPSEMPQNGRLPESKKPERQVDEIDLSGKSLEQVHTYMSNILKDGFFLHGSPNPAITELQPHEGNIGPTEYKIEAVFGTDNPLVAMANGVAGHRMTMWSHEIMFWVKDPDNGFTEKGYVYVMPPTGFERSFEAPSEVTSLQSVTPIACITYDSTIVAPFFRNDVELTPHEDDHRPFLTWLKEEGLLRESDHMAAILYLNNLTNLMPFVDYSVHLKDPKFQYIERIERYLLNMQPVFEDLVARGESESLVYLRDWYKSYDYKTMSVYECPEAIDISMHIGKIAEELGIREDSSPSYQ